MSISFPLGHLKAAALAMANKDIRYYLCGVYVEYVAGRIRLVATDGHRCHVVESMETSDPFGAFILPAATIKEVLKATKDLSAEVWIAGEVVECGEWAFRFKPVEGKFPDYRRIMTGPDDPTAQLTYQPQFLADVQAGIQAAALSTGKTAAMAFVGREHPHARGMFSLWSVANFAAKLMPLGLPDGAPNNIGYGLIEWSRT